MAKEKLLKYIVALMFFMFLFNSAILKFYWYYTIWWLDMVMHFLGGVWLGLFFLYVFYNRVPLFKQISIILLCVLLVGVLWEVFEFSLGVIANESFDILDTSSDLVFDMLGGTLALLYFSKLSLKFMPTRANTANTLE